MRFRAITIRRFLELRFSRSLYGDSLFQGGFRECDEIFILCNIVYGVHCAKQGKKPFSVPVYHYKSIISEYQWIIVNGTLNRNQQNKEWLYELFITEWSGTWLNQISSASGIIICCFEHMCLAATATKCPSMRNSLKSRFPIMIWHTGGEKITGNCRVDEETFVFWLVWELVPFSFEP